MAKVEVQVSPDLEAMSLEAARRFIAAARGAVAARRTGAASTAAVALAGGNTPRRLYELLARSEAGEGVSWLDLHFFWTDERRVHPDDPRSNYRMARESLLDHVPVGPNHVHRMTAEQPDLDAAAAAYARSLAAHTPAASTGRPRLDLVLLGMGPDGHTASLFPDDPALDEVERSVVPVKSLHGGTRRLTLTLPVLNAAAWVVFLVAGGDKAEAVRRVLGERDRRLPAARIEPAEGELVWLLDAAAAAHLDPKLFALSK